MPLGELVSAAAAALNAGINAAREAWRVQRQAQAKAASGEAADITKRIDEIVGADTSGAQPSQPGSSSASDPAGVLPPMPAGRGAEPNRE